ncbi:hypothetical protein [Paludisphaera sp.]|uniref:hypothetical protein n=1 Tax=Paludisphaera sp. TaxID=2017432 RepID=UPI00301CFC64
MKSLPRVILASVTLTMAFSFWAVRSSLQPGRGPAPSPQSPFLRDVVEPITIVDAMSFDDGGSKGLRFADARGVARDVCLEDTRVWEDDPNTLEGHHNIILNSFFPHGEEARRIPISGAEERALLGLLERWASRDPDAKELERRYGLYERGETGIEAFWDGLPERRRPKETAVSILRALRARN